jgi:hypothetical protein
MERRKYLREPPPTGTAFIYLDKRLPLVECEVVNISEGGARIVAKTATMLPAYFVLFFTPDGSERRTCRVKWRNGDDLGVAFEGFD